MQPVDFEASKSACLNPDPVYVLKYGAGDSFLVLGEGDCQLRCMLLEQSMEAWRTSLEIDEICHLLAFAQDLRQDEADALIGQVIHRGHIVGGADGTGGVNMIPSCVLLLWVSDWNLAQGQGNVSQWSAFVFAF
jgi:hypothetical protein